MKSIGFSYRVISNCTVRSSKSIGSQRKLPSLSWTLMEKKSAHELLLSVVMNPACSRRVLNPQWFLLVMLHSLVGVGVVGLGL